MSQVFNSSPPALGFLPQLYDLPEPLPVLAFLDAHPFLIPLLLEAHGTMQRYFPGAPIALKVVTDPEVSEKRELVAAIAPCAPPAEAVARFMQFMDDWWLEAADQAYGKFVITIEYR